MLRFPDSRNSGNDEPVVEEQSKSVYEIVLLAGMWCCLQVGVSRTQAVMGGYCEPMHLSYPAVREISCDKDAGQ